MWISLYFFAWSLLNLIDLWLYIFLKFGKCSAIISSNIFSAPPTFFPPATPITCMLDFFYVVPQVFEALLMFSVWFFVLQFGSFISLAITPSLSFPLNPTQGIFHFRYHIFHLYMIHLKYAHTHRERQTDRHLYHIPVFERCLR